MPASEPGNKEHAMDTLLTWTPTIIVVVIGGLIAWAIYAKGFRKFFEGVGAWWNVIAGSGGWMLLGFGYAMPSFRAVAELPVPDKLKGGVAMLAVIAAAWALFDVITKFLASTKWLLFSGHLYSVLSALLLGGLAVYSYGSGGLRYFMIAPAFYSILLLCASGIAGIQNAWQKNPTQIQRGGGE